MPAYSRATERQVAAEMAAAAKAGAAWPAMIVDYARLRAAVRACAG